GLKPDELHADEEIAAAPEGPPVEPAPSEKEKKAATGYSSGGAASDTSYPDERARPAPIVSRGPSTSALIAAGISGGLVALAGAGSMQYAGVLPSVGTAPETNTEASEIKTRLSAIENRVATLGEAPPTQPVD